MLLRVRLNEDLLGTAYAFAWGGIFVGIVGATFGTVVAACSRLWIWIWPLLGTTVVVATFVGLSFWGERSDGRSFADAVMSH